MPNGLDIWEHLVVLFVALVILVVLNRRSLRKKAEAESYDVEDEDFNNISTESFKALIDKKMNRTAEDETEQTVVSIDTGDMSR
jgi:hypothetical protein